MTDEEYFNQIKNFLSNQQQIITYKWLSSKLDVHVNTSKRLLSNFIKNHKQDENELSSTYLIGGLLLHDKGYAFEICNEVDLDNYRKKFEKVTSEHVYSLQVLPKVEDINILHNIDFDVKNKKIIQCNSCVIKDNEEIKKRRDAALAVKAIKEDPPSKVFKPQAKNQNNIESSNKIIKNNESTETNTKDENEKKKNDNEEKEKEIISNKSISNKQPAGKKKPPSKGQQGIASFFNKQKTEPKKQITVKEKEIVNKTTEVDQSPKINIKTEDIIDKSQEKENAIKTSNKPSVVKKDNIKTNGLSKTKVKNNKTKNKESQKTKTRKRIVQMSDSESNISSSESEDDIFVKEDRMRMDLEQDDKIEKEMKVEKKHSESDDEVIPPTPVQKGRKRKKKIINKTYENEEGYILTKKEVVVESSTDSEAESENKQVIKRKKLEIISDNEKNKKIKPNKDNTSKSTKQTSLKNFFNQNKKV